MLLELGKHMASPSRFFRGERGRSHGERVSAGVGVAKSSRRRDQPLDLIRYCPPVAGEPKSKLARSKLAKILGVPCLRGLLGLPGTPRNNRVVVSVPRYERNGAGACDPADQRRGVRGVQAGIADHGLLRGLTQAL
jgi:hypothetical protein